MAEPADGRHNLMTDRLIREPELLERTGMSRWTLRDWIAAGAFPKPLRLGPARITRAWWLSDVQEWADSLSTD